MKDDQANTIIILLTGILGVMLFGAGAVLSGLQFLFWIALALGIVWLIFLMVRGYFRSAIEEVREAKGIQKIWAGGAMAFLPLAGVVAVYVAVTMLGGSSYREAVNTPPVYWLGAAMLGLLGICAIASVKEWAPPLALKIATLAVLPVGGPMMEWRRLQTMKANGEGIGPIATFFGMLFAIVISLLLWLIFIATPVGLIIGSIVANLK